MRQARPDKSQNISLSVVNDFFNLTEPKPTIEACAKVKGRGRGANRQVREVGRSFKLNKGPIDK